MAQNMANKKGKPNVSFKMFAVNNHSIYLSRFPFLKEAQIKAKLLQAWRRLTDAKDKSTNIKDCQLDEGENNIPEAKVSEQRFNRSKGKATLSSKAYTATKHFLPKKDIVRSEKCRRPIDVPKPVTGYPRSRRVERKTVETGFKEKRRFLKTCEGTENEYVKAFEVIMKEAERRTKAKASHTSNRFHPEEWLDKLAQRRRSKEETGNISGMLKWRADRKSDRHPKTAESTSKETTRFFRSNENEGESNFFTMFDEREPIFL